MTVFSFSVVSYKERHLQTLTLLLCHSKQKKSSLSRVQSWSKRPVRHNEINEDLVEICMIDYWRGNWFGGLVYCWRFWSMLFINPSLKGCDGSCKILIKQKQIFVHNKTNLTQTFTVNNSLSWQYNQIICLLLVKQNK